MARPKKDKCITYTKDVHFRLTEGFEVISTFSPALHRT